ncbi:rhomboid family intramembrane serine protease [Nesterenkonia lutea]|uniref:Membrane associated rhomboid family serine protease n=1 Tax=Nesterenkonia lutea TaxID=272919 RepID=A0ABR9JGY3_9MICC|nr:rhomboid family intramembrane serine protease [Nesterenkonia lutea]MBE1525201.1 membrane associated rhomboid family serine protease [Nesterenkonia lutea]
MGYQCVDCLEQARTDWQRRRPTTRSQFGAVIRPGQRPVVTFTVIGLCVILYILQLVSDTVTAALWYAPLQTSSWTFEPWRMLTSALVHSPSNAMHLLFNMFAIWFVGRSIEPALGRLRYIALLSLSALGGSVAVLYLTPALTPTLGASGAVFGLFGALFILMRSTGSQTGGILTLIAINVVISFVIPGISWQGHFGGLLTGALCALLISKTPRARSGDPQKDARRQGKWQGLGLAGVAVLLVALTALGMQLVDPYT